MKGSSSSIAMLALASSLVTAAPLDARQAPAPGMCGATGPTATTKKGSFVLNNNLWAASNVPAPPAGQQAFQCTNPTALSADGSKLSWTSQFNWPNGASNGLPISFAYAAIPVPTQPYTPVASITSLNSSVSWTYNPSPIGDVAYDLFTAADPAKPKYPTGDFEIMVWLDRFSSPTQTIMPKSNSLNKPLVPSVNIGSNTFDFWYGVDENQETFTFVANPPLPSFSGDLNAFLQYIGSSGNYPQFTNSNQLLTAAQLGSEVWSSTALTTFTVTDFSGKLHFKGEATIDG